MRSRALAMCLVSVLAAAGCGRGCRSREPPPAPQASSAPATAAGDGGSGGAATAGGAVVPAGASGSADSTATTAGGLRKAQACTLVSRREVQEILGSPIGKPTPEESSAATACTYPPSQVGHFNQAHVTITWESPRTGPSMAHQLADAGRGTEPGPQVAQHVDLGDEADWSLDGELTVRVGPTLVAVEVGMGPESRPQTEAIARKIVDRLRGAPLPDLAHDAPEPDDDTLPDVGELLGAPKVH